MKRFTVEIHEDFVERGFPKAGTCGLAGAPGVLSFGDLLGISGLGTVDVESKVAAVAKECSASGMVEMLRVLSCLDILREPDGSVRSCEVGGPSSGKPRSVTGGLIRASEPLVIDLVV